MRQESTLPNSKQVSACGGRAGADGMPAAADFGAFSWNEQAIIKKSNIQN